MEMISGTRGIGKTKALIQKAAAVGGVIVCKDVDRMIEKIHAYGYTGINVISYKQFISESVCEDNKKYFVQRAEELLGDMNVEAFTVTTQN